MPQSPRANAPISGTACGSGAGQPRLPPRSRRQVSLVVYVAVVSPARAPLVATLQAEGRPGFVAAIEPGHNTITIVPAALTAVEQRALELWLIAPGEQPRSLGLIEAGKPVRINVPADLAGRVRADAALAVSIEPPGGSPTGLPTGPVIASGKLHKFSDRPWVLFRAAPSLYPTARPARFALKCGTRQSRVPWGSNRATGASHVSLPYHRIFHRRRGRHRSRLRCRQSRPRPDEERHMMSDKPVTVGGAPMYGNKNIIQNAVNSKDHTTLVAAVKAAGLVETLQGAGPFTVFAPTNKAFEKLPKGTVETLLKPENKEASPC